MTSQFNDKFKEFLNIPRLDEQMREAITAHNIRIENLTIDQTMEALKQALASGDFCRHIRVDPHAQTVTYMPYRLHEVLENKLLLYKKKLEAVKILIDSSDIDAINEILP